MYNYIFNVKLNNNRLPIKYLLFYIFFLKYFLIKNSTFSFFFKFSTLRKNLIVITKAPYRYKLSKHQLCLQKAKLTFIFEYTIFKFKSLNIIIFFKLLNSLASFDFCFFHLDYCKILHTFSIQE